MAVVNAYKAYDHCLNSEPRRFSIPHGAGSQNLSCVEYGYRCLQSSSVVECMFDAGHDVLWETYSNSLADGPETAWFFLCQHSRGGAIPAESCVLSQQPASLMQTQQLFLEPEASQSAKPVVWHYLTQVAIGVAFLAFGLGVFCSHKNEEDARMTSVATTPNSPHEFVPLGLLVAPLHGWYYIVHGGCSKS